MRVGEALRLDCRDLDWDQGVIQVRDAKFGKDRDLPGDEPFATRPAGQTPARRPVAGRLLGGLGGDVGHYQPA